MKSVILKNRTGQDNGVSCPVRKIEMLVTEVTSPVKKLPV